jgi:small subunit ribosomal protein S6
MRRYELMLLLRPDLEDDKLQAAVEKVTRAIVNAGGSLSKVSPWGKRRLAYDIGRHREASYFLIHFDIEPAQVREIERGLLISEEIMRHLVTVLEERGPAEELAPAAAPRALDGSEPAGAEAAEAGTVAFEADDAPAAVEEGADDAAPEASSAEVPLETGDATPETDAGAEPVDEERAEA